VTASTARRVGGADKAIRRWPWREHVELFLDEFDLVTVRIGNEGDDGGTVLHGARLPDHITTAFLDVFACFKDAIDANSDMTEPST